MRRPACRAPAGRRVGVAPRSVDARVAVLVLGGAPRPAPDRADRGRNRPRGRERRRREQSAQTAADRARQRASFCPPTHDRAADDRATSSPPGRRRSSRRPPPRRPRRRRRPARPRPTTTTDRRRPDGSGTIIAWPSGKSGYTIVLNSIPDSRPRVGAPPSAAQKAIDAGLDRGGRAQLGRLLVA